MQTIQLKIDDSIFDKFMGLIDILPKNKIQIADNEYPSISFKEAQSKVQNAINNITPQSGKSLDSTIDEIINTK